MLKIILISLLPGIAYASPFIELGIGAKFGECDCTRFDNPVGIAAVGYDFEGTGLSIIAEHRSSLVKKDYGQNVISIRYRHTFGK